MNNVEVKNVISCGHSNQKYLASPILDLKLEVSCF